MCCEARRLPRLEAERREAAAREQARAWLAPLLDLHAAEMERAVRGVPLAGAVRTVARIEERWVRTEGQWWFVPED